jgi:hypothetical protein
MALTQEDKNEIRQIIVSTLAHTCECDLSSETRAEVGHFFGRLKDHGAGNLNHGIEEFARSVAFITQIRRRGEKIGGAVSVAVFVSVATAIMGMTLLGIKAWISMCK